MDVYWDLCAERALLEEKHEKEDADQWIDHLPPICTSSRLSERMRIIELTNQIIELEENDDEIKRRVNKKQDFY